MKGAFGCFGVAMLLVFMSAALADPPPPGGQDKEREIAELKARLAELEKAPAPAAATGPATALAADNRPLVPLEQSEFVIKDAKGNFVVAAKDGSGIDGIKLSQHDNSIGSPSIAVAPDGTIHVAFCETHRTTFVPAIYHRSSSDGGKTWTEAKNLSEDLLNRVVGRCQVLVDAKNRVYVVWRAGLADGWTVSMDPMNDRCNIWFRELEGGKWSKATLISELATSTNSNDCALSFFAAVDAAGRAQVLWNVQPDKWHPEFMTANAPPSPPGSRSHSNGMLAGLVFQSTLDGSSAGKPREVFLGAITKPVEAWNGPSCDGLFTMNGYCDSAGDAHFIAGVTRVADGMGSHPTHYELIENGQAGQNLDLPSGSFHEWADIPTLLVDAKGKRHMIAYFNAGEHPNVRDYLLGSDDEPTVIRGTVGVSGVILGFQAYQGPAGRMAVLIQAHDGDPYAGDNYVSLSTGDGKWSPLVNVTNNAGRKTFMTTQTSAQSHVAVLTTCQPGRGAIAFDKDGHILLLMVKQEYASAASNAFGVNIAGGSTKTPTLRFLRF